MLGIVLLFTNAMTSYPTYDEDQYIAAGVLAQTLLPYRDFAYLQAPLYPFVLAAAFKLSGGYYLLTARLLTFALATGAASLLWRILRRLGASPGLAALLLLACITSPFVAAPLSTTRNDALPLALLLAGLAVLPGVGGQGGWAGRFAAAVLFGLAAEAKVSYVFAPIALGLHALGSPRARLLPVVLGTMLAAVPAGLCALIAPDAFRFGLLDYHLTAPIDWYSSQGRAEALLIGSKLRSLAHWLVTGGNATLLLGIAGAAVLGRRAGANGLLPMLAIGALLFGFIPSPSWDMYYAAVPPMLALCIADWQPNLLRQPPRSPARLIIALAATPAMVAAVLEIPSFALLADRSAWVGLEAHRIGMAIRQALPQAGDVATLSPRLVLDGAPVRPEFATGPFVFRSGALYGADRLHRMHALSPSTLDAALDADPPAAIYAGLFPQFWLQPMDAALIRYAEREGWPVQWIGPSGARLWVRPAR